MTITIEQLRDALVDAALANWELTIRDIQRGYVGDRLEIERLFRLVRWGWAIDKHGGYKETSDTMWCGIHVAACGMEVGDFIMPGQCLDVSINPLMATFVIPSCTRLVSDRQYRRAGVPRMERLDPKDAIRGDIVILDTPRTNRPEGDHIMLAEGPPDLERGVIACVEGNAIGTLGDGTRGEGVVRNERPLKDCLHAYRFELHHFTGSALR
jgi:hypothetical protein